MAQHGDDGRAVYHAVGRLACHAFLNEGALARELGRGWLGADAFLELFGGFGGPEHSDVQLFAQDHGGVMVDGVGDRCHDAILHQDFDQIDGAALHEGGEVAHRDRLGHDHFFGGSHNCCRALFAARLAARFGGWLLGAIAALRIAPALAALRCL